MKRIFKFLISPMPGGFKLEMPRDSKFLAVGVQNGGIALWYIHDTDGDKVPTENRFFLVIGTGEYFEAHEADYRGTVQIDPFVWHVFEMRQQPD